MSTNPPIQEPSEESCTREMRQATARLLDDLGQGMLLVGGEDDDGTIISANKTIGRMFSLSPESLVGRNEDVFWTNLLAMCVDPAAVRADLARLQSFGEETRLDILRLSQPRERVLERFTGPARSLDSGAGARIWVFRDVTRREELKEKFRRRAALEEMLRYLAAELNLDSSSSLLHNALPRLCQAERAASAVLWLLSPKQIAIPEYTCNYLPAGGDEDFPVLSTLAVRALFDMVQPPWDTPFLLTPGSLSNPELRKAMEGRNADAWLVSVIKSPDHLVGFMAIEARGTSARLWDQDERRVFQAVASLLGFWLHKRQIEEALTAARNEAEASAHAKNDFMALISHELRTPLSPLVGFTQLLEDTCTCMDPNRQEMVRKVGESARRLMDLVEDMLTLTRLDGRLDSWRKYPVAVGTLKDTIQQFMSRGPDEKVLTQRVELVGDPGTLYADGAAVKRALKALISNAQAFTPDGGEILFRILAGPSRVAFEIVDSGPGIAENRREKIFSPFVQEEPVLTRIHGGAGLGLTLVKKIAEAHQGTITVCNNKDKGCTFTLVLPRVSPDDEETLP